VGRGLLAGYAATTAVLTVVLVASVTSIPDEVRHTLIAATLGAVSLAGFVQLANIIRLQRDRKLPPTSTTEP
jgi:phytoene/squalene synthetase